MSSNYQSVAAALDAGDDPELICATCPWDRLCINPPTMTRSEVKARTEPPKMNDATLTEGARTQLLNKALMGVVVFAGRDMSATVCPVLAVRLRTSDGRALNEMIRNHMGGDA